MSDKKTIIEKGRIAPTASPVSHNPNISIPEGGNNNSGATSPPSSNENTSTENN